MPIDRSDVDKYVGLQSFQQGSTVLLVMRRYFNLINVHTTLFLYDNSIGRMQNPAHCLHSILPNDIKCHRLLLRKRGHITLFTLPQCTYNLYKNSFLGRCLFKVCIIFGRPFAKRFALCYRTVVLSCLSSSVCDLGVLWPNCLMDQDATWYAGRPRPRPHCFRLGPNVSPLQKRGTSPNFRPTSVVAKRSPVSATAEHLS